MGIGVMESLFFLLAALPYIFGIYILITIIRIGRATQHIARRVDEISARLGDDGTPGP